MQKQDPSPPRHGSRFLMTCAALVVVGAGLRELKPIALPLLVAFFLTVLSAPVFTWMTRHRVPKAVAMLAAGMMNLAVFLGLGLLLFSSVHALSAALPGYQQRAEVRVRSLLGWLESKGVDTSDLDWLRNPRSVQARPPLHLDPSDSVDPVAVPRSDGKATAPREPLHFIQLDDFMVFVGSTVRSLLAVSTMVLLVMLTMVFALLEFDTFRPKLEQVLGWTPAALDRITKASVEIQRYLLYKTLISLATGFAAGLWIWFLDLRFPVLWGLIAFILNYVPSVGSIVAAGPPVALAWVDEGFAAAALVCLGYLVINFALGNFLEPQLMGRTLGISTLVVFLSLIFWGWMWGPVGMLLAVPLTMVLRISLENTEDLRWVAQLIAARPRQP
jgi:AI-2 transport protein TqsA